MQDLPESFLPRPSFRFLFLSLSFPNFFFIVVCLVFFFFPGPSILLSTTVFFFFFFWLGLLLYLLTIIMYISQSGSGTARRGAGGRTQPAAPPGVPLYLCVRDACDI